LQLNFPLISLVLNLGLFKLGEALLFDNDGNLRNDLVMVDQSGLLVRSGNEADRERLCEPQVTVDVSDKSVPF